MITRALPRIGTASCAMWIAVLCIVVLACACGPKQYPSSRPKYGEPDRPVGPDKSHYKSQPKFQ